MKDIGPTDTLRLFLRVGLVFVAIGLLGMPAQGWLLRLATPAAERLLRLVDRPPTITSLSAQGKVIVIRSYLTGAQEPMVAWNGWSLQILLGLSVALALALPARGLKARARLLALAIPGAFVVSVAFCAVRLQEAVEEHASTHLKITLLTPQESGRLLLIAWCLGLAGFVALPAALCAVSYLSSRPRVPGRPLPAAGAARAGRARRRPAWMIPVGVACLLLAGIGLHDFLAASAPDPDVRSYLPAWEKVLRLNPAYAPAMVNVGVGLEESGRVDEAIASYRRALQLDPERVAAHYNLGRALFKKGLFAEATRSFEEVIRRAPDNAQARKNLGIALLYVGQACEALPHLIRSTELDVGMLADARLHEQIAKLRQACPARN